ncbi:MAG: ribonucleoside-diphosphate reductase, adenosylcobalamin-dependent [Omnitrophica WOR_2 bacterium RIFCSPHIGHO2_02_FULL_50_17]|nr:MAG: ribonucleoside-diphosphate reductase, adenosylcobalamin-dependent [Omnitrophica WOR_2 bacterium RIFCSPHIGHO2_02_FULL_50_17]
MNQGISQNALKVLERRYLKKDDDGRVAETPEELFRRVAKTIAAVEGDYGADPKTIQRYEEEFFQIISRLEFMPNSPTLMNAGRPLGQLSACFVLPIEDSMESIFETLKTTAIIHKTGGGTGFSFSRLREKNSIVQKTGGIASGPISFMKVFDGATQAVKQGGTRRGANMGVLRVDHPDIEEFIACKQTDKEISNFNISVAVTAKFWKALENEEDYDLISPYSGKIVRLVNSKYIFDLIVENAHRNGEPGLIFIDRMNELNPTLALGKYEATNPCGEQVLLPYESCNLGSINLLLMVKKVDENRYEVDWDKLQSTVRRAVHFLDNVIDANQHPVKEIEYRTKLTRKIGLGVMGWASMLARLGVPYNSERGLELASQVMSFILTEARIKSLDLGKHKGVFPAFDKSIFANKGDQQRFRNATLTTIAPTGTISIIAGPCSSGIEPIFSICYYRNVMDKTKLVETDPVFEEIARERGFFSPELMQKIAEAGAITNIKEIPDDVKEVFVTAHDISPEWHVRMQAAFQQFTDNAVSKTINFPHAASKEDVAKAYGLAYELGCKGITVYRDGSREDQVLNITKTKQAEGGDLKQKLPSGLGEVAYGHIEPRPRPEMMVGMTSKVTTGCGNLYVTINSDEHNEPFELFTQMGKAGGCAASQLEALGRLISLALRSGVETKEIMEQLHGIRCPVPAWNKGRRVLSCADAIAQVLEQVHKKEKAVLLTEQRKVLAAVAGQGASGAASGSNAHLNMVGVCPDCGNPLHHEEGCLKCYGCGYSRC